MSTQQQIKPETLQGKDLANVARATWREAKQTIQDEQTKSQLDQIVNELSFRVENNAQTHSQAMQGGHFDSKQAQQGSVPPAGSGMYGGSSGQSY